MKKVYFLFIVFVLPFLSVLSQNIQKAKFHHALSKEKKTKAQTPLYNKAFGDTLHYEDFSSGSINALPHGWSVATSGTTVQGWRWSTTAPGGQYTTVGPLNSTTASNGFMSLPLDSMNTPTPTGGFINIVSEMTSSAIVIQPNSNVLLSFETALRYCCNQSSVDIVLQASTDSINWDTYDASDAIAPSTSLTNATKIDLNLTQTLTLADTIYLRFKMSGASHYYWMIDDVVVYEGYENSFVIEDYSVNFTNNFTVNPVYTILPQQAMLPLSFEGATINASANIITNAYLDFEVFHDSTWMGGAGRGLVYQDSTYIADTVEVAQRDTVSVGPYFNIDNGYFRAKLSALSDSPTSTAINS